MIVVVARDLRQPKTPAVERRHACDVTRAEGHVVERAHDTDGLATSGAMGSPESRSATAF